MISTVFLVCGLHVFDVLCGNYLYFSPILRMARELI